MGEQAYDPIQIRDALAASVSALGTRDDAIQLHNLLEPDQVASSGEPPCADSKARFVRVITGFVDVIRPNPVIEGQDMDTMFPLRRPVLLGSLLHRYLGRKLNQARLNGGYLNI